MNQAINNHKFEDDLEDKERKIYFLDISKYSLPILIY